MSYNCINVPALSVAVVEEHILALMKENNMLSMASFNKSLEAESRIATLSGSRGFILDASKDRLLLSIDDKLVLLKGGKQRVTLKSGKLKNFFLHATRVKSEVFVQEYGETPTSIFVSENLENWRRLITNTELDKYSRHFHYITYDPYRKWLIATLGDGCLTRVVYSEDLGETRRPLYKGPW